METTIILAERKLSEQALQESEERYRRLLASVTDYIYTVTVRDGRSASTTHGPGCEAVTGYRPAEFDANRSLWYWMIHPEDRPAVLAQIARILKGEAPPPLEHRILHKDGRTRWIRNTPVLRRDAQGRVAAYDGLVSDITERKLAEIAVRESEERLALVIQGSSDGIWDWNVTTSAVYFSPRWKSMLGYADHEIENTFSSWERLLHPEDRERARAQVQAYFVGGSPAFELEQRLRHKDGTYRWILARGVAIRNAEGKPVRMAGSHVDLTERKQAEEQLKRAYAELARSQESLQQTLEQLQASHEELQATQSQLIQAAKFESIGTLAAGVAHEIKNPLQIILMGLEYLARNVAAGDENVALTLGDMRSAVDRANAVVRELLRFSAPTEFERKPEDLNALIERPLRLIHNQLTAARVAVVRKLAADLPAVAVDATKVEQVFTNLFINALHAMPQGGTLSVSTRLARLSEEAPRQEALFRKFKPGDAVVAAEIRDTGTGIPEAHLAKVFDPFFTTKPLGTGLGLSVAKKIVDLHGGAIDIRNAPPGGVAVTLAFPAG